MTVRGAGVGALAFGRPPIEPGQIGLGPRFIQENQLGRVPARLLLPPAPTRAGDVGPVLLAGVECLFLYVSPIFLRTTLIACKEHFSPVANRSSFRVRSFLRASKPRNWPRWAASMVGLRPEKR